MYGAVGCPDWRFCETIMYSNTLRLADYCNVQDLQLPSDSILKDIYPSNTVSSTGFKIFTI